MIELKLNNGECTTTVDGFRIDLLAELPIGFGKLLYQVLGDCPEDLKEELIKATFELTLQSMEEEAEKK